MITNIFLLLVVFKFKHLIADFFLQGKYMLRKFSPGWDFFLPLLAQVAGLFGGAVGSYWIFNLLLLAQVEVEILLLPRLVING